MDLTPHTEKMDLSEDSGCLTGSFEASNMYESTPQCTPRATYSLHKRKLGGKDQSFTRKLTNILETCPTPQFSSTLNESLVDGLEKCNLTANFYVERAELNFDGSSQTSKYFKTSSGGKLTAVSAPVTPIKQIYGEDKYLDRSQSVSGSYKVPSVGESPYKAAIEILYPHKPVIEPRKVGTPQKCGFTRAFEPCTHNLGVDPIRIFRGKTPILCKLFSYLSDGDLYRVSMVSKAWRGALAEDPRIYGRYVHFLEVHRTNKENYTYTPPDSPQSPESPPVSPGRRCFQKYVKLGKTLGPEQRLCKCAMCSNPAVVQKNIAQCQNLSCGYIYCLNCPSFSKTGPEDFHDRCRGAQLVLPPSTNRRNSRSLLSDLSNSSSTFPTDCSRTNDTSGFVSEADSPVLKVRKNLNFSGAVLADNNRNVSFVVKKRRRSSVLPVVSGDSGVGEEVVEPPSPPRVKLLACSKQSRRNLKRLLF